MGKKRLSRGRMELSRLGWEIECEGYRSQVSVAWQVKRVMLLDNLQPPKLPGASGFQVLCLTNLKNDFHRRQCNSEF